MLRAAFFVDAPHRYAGAQKSLLAALRGIRDHGVVPVAIFPGPGVCVDAFGDAHIAVRVLPAPPALLSFGQALLGVGTAARLGILARSVVPYSWAFSRLLAEEKIDVAHFNTARGILVAGLGAKMARRPSALHVRGMVAVDRVYWSAAQVLANRIILVARALLDQVSRPFRSRCRVVYNGVPEAASHDRERARHLLADRFQLAPRVLDDAQAVFVSLSSYVPFKGLHHLLYAAHALGPPGKRLVFLLAGSGDDREYDAWLHALRERLGLDNVVLCGQVRDPTELLAAADALVLPSVVDETLTLADGVARRVRGNEGLPRSILEAMSFGLPVIATRIAGVAEQVEDGTTGWLVPPGDDNALATAIARVAGDRAWRDDAGARARIVVAQKFSVEAASQGLADTLFTMVKSKVGSRINRDPTPRDVA